MIARFTLFQTRIKGLTRSSGFQKLENSNLEILKFEARFAYAVKFWPEPFDLKSSKFLPNDILRQILLPTKKLLKLITLISKS